MCWKPVIKDKIMRTEVSVAGCLGYDVLGACTTQSFSSNGVSVAGCLGYDVLVKGNFIGEKVKRVSVAGCLGYDVLVNEGVSRIINGSFSCWLFRL